MNERNQLEMLTIEQLVLENHLVRKLDASIDFSFVYPLVENFIHLSVDLVLIRLFFEEAEHLRHHHEIKSIYTKRKETVERVFADAKEKHVPQRGDSFHVRI